MGELKSVEELDRMAYELAAQCGRELARAGWLIVTAESCTGGAIARALTEVGGSSQWFERGFVTYSNEAKQESLGVAAASIEAHGAVSEVVAREMAQGALRASRARIAVAVTGVAGPSGGSPAKPVGTVAFGWATHQRVESRTRLFTGNRAQVRLQTVLYALTEVRRWLPPTPSTGLA